MLPVWALFGVSKGDWPLLTATSYDLASGKLVTLSLLAVSKNKDLTIGPMCVWFMPSKTPMDTA